MCPKTDVVGLVLMMTGAGGDELLSIGVDLVIRGGGSGGALEKRTGWIEVEGIFHFGRFWALFDRFFRFNLF